MSSTTPTGRRTAAERREEILEAALTEFAVHGFDGASTDAIARRVGISQPYLFRLFGTKKELFIATIERCMGDSSRGSAQASDGPDGRGGRAPAMGRAYVEMITTDPGACAARCRHTPRARTRRSPRGRPSGFGRLVEHVEGLGVTPAEVAGFFATGMLINVLTVDGPARPTARSRGPAGSWRRSSPRPDLFFHVQAE